MIPRKKIRLLKTCPTIGFALYVGHRKINLKKKNNIELGRKSEEDKIMDKYVCSVCGYVYDSEEGDPDNGINPGTPFEDLPDDWTCPDCGVSKDEFEKEE